MVYAEAVGTQTVRVTSLPHANAQAAGPPELSRIGHSASDISLRTDLELARRDNRALRAEFARLKTVLRESLGDQLEMESRQSLRLRIDDLTAANNRYHSESLSPT